MHYTIVLLPLPFIGLAYLVERLVQRKALVGAVAIAATAFPFAFRDVHFFRTVIHDGGAPGDYGVAYRYTEDAVSSLLRRSAGRPFEIGVDTDFKSVPRLRPYRFLIWNADPDGARAIGPARTGYLIIDTFTSVAPRLGAGQRTVFGPLEVVTVPLGR